MEPKKERIKIWMGACIVIVALFIDLFEFITTWLGIGIITSVIIVPGATLLFWIWYKMLGVPFIASPKKFAILFVTSFVEIIPALDAIPLASFGWTIGALVMVAMVRMEDGGGILGQLSSTSMSMLGQSYIKNKHIYNNRKEFELNRKKLAFSKEELASEAGKRNPYFKTDQYKRALNMVGNNMNNRIGNISKQNAQ